MPSFREGFATAKSQAGTEIAPRTCQTVHSTIIAWEGPVVGAICLDRWKEASWTAVPQRSGAGTTVGDGWREDSGCTEIDNVNLDLR